MGHRDAGLLDDAMRAVQRWQAKTFGECSPVAARAEKMVDEAREVVEAVKRGLWADRSAVLDELADVFFLIADVARFYGEDGDDLAQAVKAKLARNEARTWTADETGKFSGTKESK